MKNLMIRRIFIVLIIGLILLFSFILSSVEARIVREPKEIHSPPGVNAEALLSNLYAMMNALDITSDEFAKVFPSLSYISNKNFADHRLNKEEFDQIVKKIFKTIGKELRLYDDGYSPYYKTYSLTIDSLPRSYFPDLLSIFEQEFVRILNTGQMQKVFRMIECLRAAEYIGGETLHLLGHGEDETLSIIFYWHKWILTGEGNLEIGHRKLLLEKFNLGNFSLEDKKMTLAYTYILLTTETVRDVENKAHLYFLENFPRLLKKLSEDQATASSIKNIKKIIQELNISPELRESVISQFP